MRKTKMKELTVFDVQRFALHDGPGIRTTIFVKGCPLDCVWCHNPESKRREPQLGFLEKKCIGCGKCVTACENNVHKISEQGVHEIDYRKCKTCGKCVDACLEKALKIYGTKMTAEEIMDIVMKDADFYRTSGGGLTVSGGEPMLQYPALLNLLQKAKEKNLHVCLDTCGQAQTEKYAEIAKYVDLFLFDYKITDADEHKRYTGVDNKKILENLDYLCTHGKDVFLRCPIIPGINDKAEHYRAIAELSEKYEAVRQVNLMTYHDMAKGKSAQIGERYELSDIKTIEKEEKYKIYEQVESYGCTKLYES